jgi:hypothetical protein
MKAKQLLLRAIAALAICMISYADGGHGTHLPDYFVIRKYSNEQDDNKNDIPRQALSGEEEDGKVWECKFSDKESLLNVSIGDALGQIIYSDDNWIVKEHSYTSSYDGCSLFNLYFFDSRTLKLISVLQSPNFLYRIIEIPKKRNVFAILVQSPNKFSLGPTPTLLLANPHTKELHGVALRGSLWREALDLDVIDKNIRVLVDWDGNPSFTEEESKGGAFSGSYKDVTYSLHDVQYSTPPKTDNSSSLSGLEHLKSRNSGFRFFQNRGVGFL